MSISDLVKKVKSRNYNPTVVGLDPRIDYVPDEIKSKKFVEFGPGLKFVAESILEFNKGIIDAVCDIVAAVKPQSAYYELCGVEGKRVLAETIKYAKQRDMYVIADVKRGDIAATCAAYADAYIGKSKITDDLSVPVFDSDSITVNPYFGTDGITPFLERCKNFGKSIFVLVKTSNKSSGELQNLQVDGVPLYEKVAEFVSKWGENLITGCGYSEVGAVVGATYPEIFGRARKIMPKSYLLIPGYGAQGGTAKDLKKCFDSNGLGAVVNASRSIICAHMKTGEDFKIASRKAAEAMKNDILSAISK
jgi:orotidine-5'-phosphate decarboxylase